MSIALIVVAFSSATDIIINLMPFLAVSLVILLVFMLLYGFVASGDEGLKITGNVRKSILGLIIIALVIAVLVVTGQWDRLYYSLFINYGGSSVLTNIILLVIIAGAIFAVVYTGKGRKPEKP